MDKTYADTPTRLNKLHGELLAAGITPTLVESDAGGPTGDPALLGTWVHIVAPQAEAAVDAVVAAHAPTTPGPAEELVAADATTVDAFHTGWVAGQARLGNVGAQAIQNQMDTIEAANITTLAAAAVHIKTLAEAVEDLARQLRVLKRTVAIRTGAPDRLGG